MQVAWETDPLTRPADIDYTDLADEDVKVRTINTTRGGRIRTGEIVAGKATALLDFPNRVLEPRYAGSPWYPNVDVRRRVRFIVTRYAEDGSETTEVIWTGFISRLPNTWRKAVALTNLSAVGLLAIISNEQLPPSVLDITMRELAPVSYWPMTETAGTFADDVIGTNDGVYQQPVTGTGQTVPFDARGCVTTKMASPAGLDGQWNNVSIQGSAEVTIGIWFQWQDGIPPQVIDLGHIFGDDGYITMGIGPIFDIDDQPTGEAIFSGTIGSGPDVLQVFSTVNIPVFDAGSHLMVLTVNASVAALSFGVNLTYDGADVSLDVDYSLAGGMTEAELEAAMEGFDTGKFGWGAFQSANVPGSYSANAGHAFYADYEMSTAEGNEIWVAGTNPWDGDTTGERLDRVLDLVGVDPDDRDIDTGSQICGPADLKSQRVGPYINLVAATERGPVFETAGGKIALREQLPNNPDVAFTLSDDPTGDDGTPYEPIEADYSTARMVNIAEVTRVGGNAHRVEDATSVAHYGPVPIRIDTLYASPDDARAAAAELVERNKTPRLLVDGVTVSSRHAGEVPAAVSLLSEVAEVPRLFARPPGGGDPIEQRQQIESITQTLDGSGQWKTSFGLYEHVVLPCFTWGVSGAGWGDSVWCEGA